MGSRGCCFGLKGAAESRGCCSEGAAVFVSKVLQRAGAAVLSTGSGGCCLKLTSAAGTDQAGGRHKPEYRLLEPGKESRETTDSACRCWSRKGAIRRKTHCRALPPWLVDTGRWPLAPVVRSGLSPGPSACVEVEEVRCTVLGGTARAHRTPAPNGAKP